MQYSDDLKNKISTSTKCAMANLSQDKKDAMKSKIGHKSKPLTDATKLKISLAKKGKHWRLEDGKRIYY